jgi:hypothetical protein
LFALHARNGLAELLSTSRSRLERAEGLDLANEVRTDAQRLGLNALRAAAQLTLDRLATSTSSSRLTRPELEEQSARGKRMRLR